jgi:cellulose synthase/poly-beta-1,6-N-acetylglucosamine synthase-like glycosyltransferase
MFYRLHAFVDDIFQEHKSTLPRYDVNKVSDRACRAFRDTCSGSTSFDIGNDCRWKQMFSSICHTCECRFRLFLPTFHMYVWVFVMLILVTCVLVFTVFLYCFIYVCVFSLILSVQTPSDNLVAVSSRSRLRIGTGGRHL